MSPHAQLAAAQVVSTFAVEDEAIRLERLTYRLVVFALEVGSEPYPGAINLGSGVELWVLLLQPL